MSDLDPSDSDGDLDSTTGRRSLVQLFVDDRDFEEFGAELERLWTTNDDEQRSLRELARLFNRRVLADEADRAWMQFLDGELEEEPSWSHSATPTSSCPSPSLVTTSGLSAR